MRYALLAAVASSVSLLQAPSPDTTISLAAHRIIAVGGSVDVAAHGEIVEVVSVQPADVLTYSPPEASVACVRGGVGFVRARYRDEGVGENRIQTQVVTCVDEVGVCGNEPRLSLDLEAFRTEGPSGESNAFASGEGRLWALCLTRGFYRLQQPPAMPPPMHRLVDGLADGPYTLGDSEFASLRRAKLTSYSGTEWSPPWMATVSREVTVLALNGDGTVTINGEDCDMSPSCTSAPDFLREGDLLVIGFGAPTLESVVAATSDAVLRDFVAAHVPVNWNAIAALGPARSLLVYRLVGLEVMRQLLPAFDAAHGLRAARIPIGYFPNFKTRPRLRSQCPSGARGACDSVEALLDAHERSQIRSWRNAGYDLWFQEIIGHASDGVPTAIADSAPSFEAFGGVVALVDFGPPVAGAERGNLMSNTVSALATAVGSMPVVIAPRGAPLEAVVTSRFCEGSICPSAFSTYYAAYERAIQTMLSRFAPGQIRNFAIPTFEGAHFDIREPYERYDLFSLNRVGETGFNNPLLNLYIAR